MTAGQQAAADRTAPKPCTDGSRRPNVAGYAWGQPYVCTCGSVSSFPCNCRARSTAGTAAAA